jgi:hypothetical protein
MPTRLIREALLDSERYWSTTIEARQLFIHLMLLADDVGCVSLAPVFVSRRCFDDRPNREKVDLLLQQLHDVDLLRIYEHEGGRYGFIPRFRQRIQIRRLKHPLPPAALLHGDLDAQEKIQSINNQTEKSPAEQRQVSAGQLSEAKTEAEAEAKERQLPGVIAEKRTGQPTPPNCPHEQIIELYHEALPSLRRVRAWTPKRQQYLSARWREMCAAGKYTTVDQGLAFWKKFFRYVASSDFLMGQVPPRDHRKPFQADLEWLVTSTNFVKVIEGKYESAVPHDAA